MEENTIAKTHKLILNNRHSGSFTGILDVLSFDLSEVLFDTEMVMLHIKVKDLHVYRLNLEKGEADIEGEIDAMTYSAVPAMVQKQDGFFGKLFR